MKILITALLLIIVSVAMQAQATDNGNLNIYADQRIEELVNLHIEYNEEFPILEGYRIQLFMESGNEALTNAEEVVEKFNEKYKDIPAYITFGEPYYRVRVGDFRTRLEAEKFLNRIDRAYPNAWVTLDIINLPELPKYQTKTNKYE